MEDNACCWQSFGLSWKNLVDKLCKKIGNQNIKASSPVSKITKVENKPCIFMIEVEGGHKFLCNKVIMATTIKSLQLLLPQYPVYKEIEGQPFLRLYGKFDSKSTELMKKLVKGYTVLTGPLQKIIPMDADKGVYMIAYNDNKNTVAFKDYLTNTEINRIMYCRLLEKALGLPKDTLKLLAIKGYYWDIGTHYYKPLDTKTYSSREEFVNKAQHPESCILVVGEVVSRDQGWVQGALDSVNKGLNKKWIDNIS